MDINKNFSRVNFGRAFSTEERKQAEEAQKEAKKLLNINKVILITPDTSLPAGKNDIGIGQMNNKHSEDFYKFMQSYAGINQVKLLPQGELTKNPNGLHCSYSGSSMTLGSHTVNLEELTKPEMGKILSQETFENVKKGANSTTDAVFENVVGDNNPHTQAMREAFDNFKKSDAPELAKLKEEFNLYKVNNKGTIETRALYEVLKKQNNNEPDFKKWANETDRELFNEDIVKKETRSTRINELKTQHPDDIEFTYFKQFMADKNLEKAKKNLNNQGIEVYGDCLMGFSKDEIWSHPKAFEKNAYIGDYHWKIPALNFSTINDEKSESFQLLKQKVEYFSKRYDHIRFDVGWAYENPLIFSDKPESVEGRYKLDKLYLTDEHKNEPMKGYRLNNNPNGGLLDKIEKVVKDVKGEDYDVKNLIYETEAGPNEFTPFKWDNEKGVIDAFKNRSIVQSTSYLSDGYGTNEMMEKTMRVPRDNYVYMVGNHDHLSLKALSEGKDTDGMLQKNKNNVAEVLNNQYKPLARELGVKEEEIKASKDFVKGKFGHIFLAKNIKMFFMDVFGSDRQFDSQEANSGKNYRPRVPSNFEKSYHEAIQNHDGLNLYDALGKAMKARGIDQSHPKLYSTITKFANILFEKGALTEEEANRSAINTAKDGVKEVADSAKEASKPVAETVTETVAKSGNKAKYVIGTIAGLGVATGAVKLYQKYNNRNKLQS